MEMCTMLFDQSAFRSRWILTNGAFGRIHSVSLTLFVGNTVYVCGLCQLCGEHEHTPLQSRMTDQTKRPSYLHNTYACIFHQFRLTRALRAASCLISQHSLQPNTMYACTIRLICILTHWGRISLKRGSGAFTLLTNQASNATFGSCCGADETKIVSWSLRVLVLPLFWVRGWMRFVCGRRG